MFHYFYFCGLTDKQVNYVINFLPSKNKSAIYLEQQHRKSQVPHCFTDGQRDEVNYLVAMLLKWGKIEIR